MDSPRGKGFSHAEPGFFCQGDAQQPACVLINPVNNAGPKTALNFQLWKTGKQTMHESPYWTTRRGVDDQTRSFIHNKKVLIFIEDIKIALLRHDLRR